GGKAAFALLGAATTVVIARRLGPSGQGIFAVAFNLTLMLVQLGSAGMPVAGPVFVARGQHSRAVIIANSLLMAGVIGVLLAALPVRAPGRALLRVMLLYGLRVYAVGLVAFVLIRLDLLLVNAILGNAQAGRYSLAGTIAEALTLLPSIIGVNMLPRLARVR